MRVGWEAAAALAVLATGCALGREVWTVDSVEEGRAVLVGPKGEVATAAASELPAGSSEGDVLVDWSADEKERERLLFDIRQTRERLQQKSGGTAGDLSLVEGP